MKIKLRNLVDFYIVFFLKGLVFFFVTGLGGWLIYDDLPNISIILIGAIAVLIKSFFQYGPNPFADEP